METEIRQVGEKSMKKGKLYTIILSASMILAACSGQSTDEKATPKENPEVNIKEMVQEFSSSNSTDQSASITSTQLIVKDSEENEVTYELPEEEFFVSIAPYINETHP